MDWTKEERRERVKKVVRETLGEHHPRKGSDLVPDSGIISWTKQSVPLYIHDPERYGVTSVEPLEQPATTHFKLKLIREGDPEWEALKSHDGCICGCWGNLDAED